jgi:hypothetical protein
MKVKMIVKIPNWLDKIIAWPIVIYRLYKYGYKFRRIRLTEGKYAKVSPCDFHWLNKYDWFAKSNSKNIYAVRINNENNGKPRLISMHREICNMPKGLVVDHKNRDTLDNYRENLRAVTISQNGFNRSKRTDASSKYFGVCFDKTNKQWCAFIRKDGKSKWLGRFSSEIEAARVYDATARKYRGEFAILNFPDEIFSFEYLRDNIRKAKKSKTSSKFIGVRYIKKNKIWGAQIKVAGKDIWLGRFTTELEAAKAYDSAARKYRGEKAVLNFPFIATENTEDTENLATKGH